MGIGVTFGIIGVAKTFVPLFFGPGYEPVVNLLYILSPLVLIIGVSGSLSSQYYTPVGKRNKISKFLISGSVINLILNLSLIPSFGAVGATIASLVAETVITTLFITQQVQKLYTEASLGTSRWCRKTAQEALPLPCASSSCCEL